MFLWQWLRGAAEPTLSDLSHDGFINLTEGASRSVNCFSYLAAPDGISEETVKIRWKIWLEFQQPITAPEYLV